MPVGGGHGEVKILLDEILPKNALVAPHLDLKERLADAKGHLGAQQLVVKDAVAAFMRAALLRGADNDHLIALESVPSGAVSGLPETPANTFLLGKPTDPSFFRYEKKNGAWEIATRLATLFIEGLKSKIRGVLQVFRDSQDIQTGKPVFEVNPGSANGGESTTVRGAFRVRKSPSDDAAVLEALPNGDVRGVSFLGKIGDGATAANIFACPPLDKMGGVSHHHFEANPFPTANKSPIQSGGPESWDVLTLRLAPNRAVQIAVQAFNIGATQSRVFVRSRHVDNDDYSQWQGWREIVRQGDNAVFWNLKVDQVVETVVLEFTRVPSNAGHGGAIDFHFNGSSADYTSRIIESAPGTLSIDGGLYVDDSLSVGGDPAYPAQ